MDEKGRFKNQRGFDESTAHLHHSREEKKHGKMPAVDERKLGYGERKHGRDNKPKPNKKKTEEIPLSK